MRDGTQMNMGHKSSNNIRECPRDMTTNVCVYPQGASRHSDKLFIALDEVHFYTLHNGVRHCWRDNDWNILPCTSNINTYCNAAWLKLIPSTPTGRWRNRMENEEVSCLREGISSWVGSCEEVESRSSGNIRDERLNIPTTGLRTSV